MNEGETKDEKTNDAVVESQTVQLADTVEQTAPVPEAENAASEGKTDARQSPSETTKEAEPVKEELWTSIQNQLAEMNRKIEALSRRVAKQSSSAKSPSNDESAVDRVSELKVASPPAQTAKEKQKPLRKRARAAKKLPRPKKRGAAGKS